MTTRIQQIADQFQLSSEVIKGIIQAYDPAGIQQPPQLACDAYLRKKDPEGDGLFARARGERRVVWNLFQYLGEHGWFPHIYNDGDSFNDVIEEEDKILEAMNAVFAVDECAVGISNNGGKTWHDIVFVLGNSAEEVVSDWHYQRDDKDGFHALMEAFDAEKFA